MDDASDDNNGVSGDNGPEASNNVSNFQFVPLFFLNISFLYPKYNRTWKITNSVRIINRKKVRILQVSERHILFLIVENYAK